MCFWVCAEMFLWVRFPKTECLGQKVCTYEMLMYPIKMTSKIVVLNYVRRDFGGGMGEIDKGY